MGDTETSCHPHKHADTTRKSILLTASSFLQKDLAISKLLAWAKLILTFPLLGFISFSDDEMQFFTYTEHLAWGYVDDVPFVIWMQALAEKLFGHSEYAIRIFPLIAGALSVYAAGVLARELGGKWKAQAAASLCLLSSPQIIFTSCQSSVSAYEPAFWLAIFCIMAKVLKEGLTAKLSSVLGAILGFAVLNKLTIFFLAACLWAGLALAGKLAIIKDKKLYLAFSACIIFTLPSIIWWSQHEWSGIDFLLSCAQHKTGLQELLLAEILSMNAVSFCFCAIGLAGLLFSKSLNSFKTLGFACLIYIQIIIILQGQPHYLVPALFVLCPASAALLEKNAGKIIIIPALLMLTAFLACILCLTDIFFPEISAARLAGVTLGFASDPEDFHSEGFKELLNHRWKERTTAVKDAVSSLTEKEREEAIIFTIDNAMAGALSLEPGSDLPPIVCNHYSSYYWELPRQDISVVVSENLRHQDYDVLQSIFGQKEEKNYLIRSSDGSVYKNMQIIIWRAPKQPHIFKESWPRLKFIGR
ncbi:MAG: glycosyltransferase family 39 protein [bacterium]|nr:glycosyltransferase family 39 protein [bacterium]